MDEEVRRVTGRVCSQQRADCGGTTRSALRTRGEAEPATFGARRGRRVVSADLRHSWADAAIRRRASVQPAGPRRPPRPWKGRSRACRAVPGAPLAWVARSTSLETRFETIFSYAMGYELIFLLLLQLNSQSIIWNCMTFLGETRPCFGDGSVGPEVSAPLACPTTCMMASASVQYVNTVNTQVIKCLLR